MVDKRKRRNEKGSLSGKAGRGELYLVTRDNCSLQCQDSSLPYLVLLDQLVCLVKERLAVVDQIALSMSVLY